MAGHPQGSNRGLKVMAVAAPTSLTITNSTASVLLGVNSSGLTLNSTGKGIKLGSTSTSQMTTNTTGIIIAKQLRVGAKTTYLSSNTTGVKLGAKYITGNTTAN